MVAVYVQIARDAVVGLAALGAYIAYVRTDILVQAIGLATALGIIFVASAGFWVVRRVIERRNAGRKNR